MLKLLCFLNLVILSAYNQSPPLIPEKNTHLNLLQKTSRHDTKCKSAFAEPFWTDIQMIML
jgi:hypothetical protein